MNAIRLKRDLLDCIVRAGFLCFRMMGNRKVEASCVGIDTPTQLSRAEGKGNTRMFMRCPRFACGLGVRKKATLDVLDQKPRMRTCT